MVAVVLTPGVDSVSGTPSQRNFFYFTPSTLQSNDSILGAASALDVAVLTASGTVVASQFAGVQNLEELRLAGAGDNVTLTDALIAGSSAGYFTIVDGAASDWR